MRNNIDMRAFGLFNLKCKRCGKELDISELDFDCDIISHRPNQFEITLHCGHCDYEDNDFIFNITSEKD